MTIAEIIEEIRKREQQSLGAAHHCKFAGMQTGAVYECGQADALAWVRGLLEQMTTEGKS